MAQDGLVSRPRAAPLTIDNAAAGSLTLKVALVWWRLGMLLAAVYFVFAYRMFFRGGQQAQPTPH